MKPLKSKDNMRVPAALAALMLGSSLMMPVAGMCAADVVQYSGNVAYVSGGVSDESLDQLKANAANFNLKLVFALKSGAFMSDVGVAIIDRAGNTVLTTTSEGPWLLAKLPSGGYHVVATAGGISMTRNVAIDGHLTTVDFRWSSE